MSTLPHDNAEEVTAAPEGEEPVEETSKPADAPVPSGLVVTYAGRTAVGLVREHNEDNLVIANLGEVEPAPREELRTDTVGEHGMLFAVCDGMGGAAAGEVASQMAVEILLEALRRGGPPGERDALAGRLVSAVEEAGRRIYTAAQSERAKRGMGTTATVAVLLDKVLFLAEVGDSRGYLLRDGVLKQVTKDQSLVNQLIEAGHLTPEEAEAFEHSNIILQALGTSDTVQVDLTFVELRRGDRLMMCSDGLSGLVHDDSIRDALVEFTDPVECTKRLVQYAEAGGGHDNITVIVADFDGDELSPAKETDAFGYMQYPLVPSGAPAASDDLSTTIPGTRTTVPPPNRADGGVWSWLIAGVAALVVGGAVLALSAKPAAESTVEPVPKVAPVVQPEPAPVVEKVAVRVFSDVERATLLVNGESHGTLPADGELPLSLVPGAYRFEAESDGNIAAVAVVTVRPEVPLDVYLNLPQGTEVGEDEDEDESEGPQDREPGSAREAIDDVAPKARPATTKEPAAPPAAKPAQPPAASSPTPAPPSAPATPAPSAPATPAPSAPGTPTPTPPASTAPQPVPAPGTSSTPPALPQNPF